MFKMYLMLSPQQLQNTVRHFRPIKQEAALRLFSVWGGVSVIVMAVRGFNQVDGWTRAPLFSPASHLSTVFKATSELPIPL